MFNDQQRQVYTALMKWAERLNNWEYSIQYKQQIKSTSQYYSLILLEVCRQLIKSEITAEKAISLLHTPEGREQLNLCIEAGF
jgi:hypothetical protein